MMLATEKLESYDPINIGLGKGYTIKEALKMMLEIDGYTNAKVVFDPSKPSMIPIRLIDITRAEELLGFRPRTGLPEGIRQTIRWYRKTRPGQASDNKNRK